MYYRRIATMCDIKQFFAPGIISLMEKENLKPSKFDKVFENFLGFSFMSPTRHLICKQTNPINNCYIEHL